MDASRSASVRGKKKKKKVWWCIKASESELWNWPTQHEKRKRGGLPDESLKSESEPCRAPATYVCVRQCVFHHRWLLKLWWVHEFQAVGLQFFFFFSLRGKQKGYTCALRMLSAFCSGSEVYSRAIFRVLSAFIEVNPRWHLSARVAAADVLPLCAFQVGDAGGRRAGRRTQIYGGGTSESLFCQLL